jgi:hypothetical protein
MATPNNGSSGASVALNNPVGFGLVTGKVPVGEAAIYTVPASKQAIVAFIYLFNNNGASATVKLYVNTGTDLPILCILMATLDSHVYSVSMNLPSGCVVSATSDQTDVTFLVQVREY